VGKKAKRQQEFRRMLMIERAEQEARFAAQYDGDPWCPVTDILDELALIGALDGRREELQDALAFVWQHGRADAVDSLTLTIPSEGSDTPEYERRLIAH
jgi:hypothetical protein